MFRVDLESDYERDDLSDYDKDVGLHSRDKELSTGIADDRCARDMEDSFVNNRNLSEWNQDSSWSHQVEPAKEPVFDGFRFLPNDIGGNQLSVSVFERLESSVAFEGFMKHDGQPAMDLQLITPRQQSLQCVMIEERQPEDSQAWSPETLEPMKKKKQKPTNQKSSDLHEQQASLNYGDLFTQIKNTNMPKKFLKMFKGYLKTKVRNLKITAKLPNRSADAKATESTLLKMLVTITNKLERKNIENAGTRDLACFFVGDDAAAIESRKLMKRCLGQLVFDEVLRNDSIPTDNKFSYLKCLKTMEWRMRTNDDSLVTRVQSNY